MRSGISRRWAAAIGAAVVLGVSGLGVWGAHAGTAKTNNTDVIWTVDSTTGSAEVDKKLHEFSSRTQRFSDVIWT